MESKKKKVFNFFNLEAGMYVHKEGTHVDFR